MEDLFLPGLPVERIRACYAGAPGDELGSGKFASPESSAALVANTFGLFLDRPAEFPPLSGGEAWGWPATKVQLEAVVRFPWSGGRHPCLDVLIETRTALIGIESKRYEPFRPKSSPDLSDAYWRPVWGEAMSGYQRVRDRLHARTDGFRHLDATQLVKHAFGLRTAVHRDDERKGKQPVLLYLFAEPAHWPDDGRALPTEVHAAHRAEIARFAQWVAGDEVAFHACSYRDLLGAWQASGSGRVRAHAEAVLERFAPL